MRLSAPRRAPSWPSHSDSCSTLPGKVGRARRQLRFERRLVLLDQLIKEGVLRAMAHIHRRADIGTGVPGSRHLLDARVIARLASSEAQQPWLDSYGGHRMRGEEHPPSDRYRPAGRRVRRTLTSYPGLRRLNNALDCNPSPHSHCVRSDAARAILRWGDIGGTNPREIHEHQ